MQEAPLSSSARHGEALADPTLEDRDRSHTGTAERSKRGGNDAPSSMPLQ